MSYRTLRSLRSRVQRRTLLAATVASLLGLFAPAADAQLQWDPGFTPLIPSGGTGVWDATTLNWSNGASPNVAWNSLNAIFGGSSGTVTIDNSLGTVSATGLTFNTAGYTLSGGPLAITGAAAINGTGDATISSVITGSPFGFTKSGTNVITLSGVNTFFGNVAINGGGLVVNLDSGLGDASNSVSLDGGFLRTTATYTSGRNYTVGVAGGTLDVSGASTLTISTAFDAGGGNVFNKIGTGTLALGTTSTRFGVNNINDGRIAITNITALGTGAVNVTGANSVFEINTVATNSAQAVNVGTGGTFQWTQNAQLTLLAGNELSFTGTTGTLNVGGTGSTGKVLANAGLISSVTGSTVTKTGGGVLQLAGANTGWLGNVNINAGTVEFQNVDSLGTAVKTVTISGTGEFVTAGISNRNNFVLAGGTLSANGAANYTGTVTAQASTTSTISMRHFQTPATAQSFTISGALGGSGTVNVTAPAAATLTLSANNSAFAGTLNIGSNVTTNFTSRTQFGTTGTLGLTGGTVNMRFANTASPTIGTAGLNATYYNFGVESQCHGQSFAVCR